MAAERSHRQYRSLSANHVLRPGTVAEEAPLRKLNLELLATYEKIRLSDAEIGMRDVVLQRYRRLLRGALECEVEPYGSSRTMLLVHGSDIDITVLVNTSQRPGAKEYSTEKHFSNVCLARIRTAIEGVGYARGGILHIRKAKTPILRFEDRLYGHSIDVSINKMDGVHAAEYVVREVAARPFLRYFAVLLKYFLKRRNLSDASCGGLCSYAQFLMILDFVNLHPLIQSGSLAVEDNMGVLLLDFFQYFGVDFPYERSVISVRDGRYKPNREGCVCIEDPVAEGHNVAYGCTSMRLIRDVFVYSYRVMAAALSSRIDAHRSVVDLWLRLDQGEMRQRERLLRGARR